MTFHVDIPGPEPLPAKGESVGVDVGLTHFAALSAGEKIGHPKDWERHERRLAREISCTGWGEHRRMLEYKAGRYGRAVAVVDRWYPSSKTCSACGHLLATLSLGTRCGTCPACGTRHDRDINAAKNILAAGLAVTACGGDTRRMGTPPARPPVKQETRPVREGVPVLQGGEEVNITLPPGIP